MEEFPYKGETSCVFFPTKILYDERPLETILDQSFHSLSTIDPSLIEWKMVILFPKVVMNVDIADTPLEALDKLVEVMSQEGMADVKCYLVVLRGFLQEEGLHRVH